MPLFVRRYDVSRARTLAEYHWVPFTFFLEGNSTATHSGFPARIFRVRDSQIHVVHVLAHYTDVRESRTSKYKIHAESIFYNHLMKCRARIQESLFALQMHNLIPDIIINVPLCHVIIYTCHMIRDSFVKSFDPNAWWAMLGRWHHGATQLMLTVSRYQSYLSNSLCVPIIIASAKYCYTSITMNTYQLIMVIWEYQG